MSFIKAYDFFNIIKDILTYVLSDVSYLSDYCNKKEGIMMKDVKEVTFFRGDGIGPEISDSVFSVFSACKVPVHFDVYDVGQAEYDRHGKLIPDEALASFERTKVLLKSPVTTPVGKGFRSINVTLRKKYDLYANFRPAKSNPAVPTPFPHTDIVTFRENTEDLYAGIEEKISDTEMHSIKVITKAGSERICRAAFDYAVANGRKKVTCVHKANIMKLSDGLFLNTFREVSKDYPDILATDMIVDACCMNLVLDPTQFDVIVTENLYGDILTDLTSGLIGGVGLMPSSNCGTDMAMFEAVHGSAPDIAGKNLANPTAFIWAACMMLDHIGLSDYAAIIRSAIKSVMDAGVHTTLDIGGTASTTEYTAAICKEISRLMTVAA